MRKILMITVIISFFYNCCPILRKNINNDVAKELNLILLKKDSLLLELKNSYKFKYYEDGLGPDLTKPVFNDTLIFLKNNFSKKINLKLINNSKILLLDSISICELSIKNDSNKQIMRRFLVLEEKYLSNCKSLLIIKSKSWVPQFKGENINCVEVFKEVKIGEFEINY